MQVLHAGRYVQQAQQPGPEVAAEPARADRIVEAALVAVLQDQPRLQEVRALPGRLLHLRGSTALRPAGLRG